MLEKIYQRTSVWNEITLAFKKYITRSDLFKDHGQEQINNVVMNFEKQCEFHKTNAEKKQ